MAAFHGNPVIAYDRKSEIWISDQLYSSFFKEETTAKHIVFAYSLYKTIGEMKLQLVGKQKNGIDLTQTESEQLEFLEKKGAILLICAAIADCLEAVLGRALPNKFRLSFGPKVSPDAAQQYWAALCPPLLALVKNLDAAFSSNRVTTGLAKKGDSSISADRSSCRGAEQSCI